MSQAPDFVPVVTVDGPSGAGKGAVAQRVAGKMGWHLLDSGAVYRAAALHVLRQNVDLNTELAVVAALESFNAIFNPTDSGVNVLLDGVDISVELRGEAAAGAASRIAVMPTVRTCLLEQQRSFRQSPGLVADGRDMGTVVFPDASLKVFLTASTEERAKRRAKQLKEKGISTTMARLVQDIEERDLRDSTRKHSPLVAAAHAIVIDSSNRSIDNVVQQIVEIIVSQ